MRGHLLSPISITVCIMAIACGGDDESSPGGASGAGGTGGESGTCWFIWAHHGATTVELPALPSTVDVNELLGDGNISAA